ncbi:MAG: DnaK suppressor protein [Rhodothermales bacterium]|jgi:DnaK suppressor protein
MPELDPASRKRELIALADELRRQVDRPDDAASSVTVDNAIGRLTRMEAVQAQQMGEAGRRRIRARLQSIEQAIAALDAGTYGICVRCGEAIPAGRMEFRPESRTCVTCAAAR